MRKLGACQIIADQFINKAQTLPMAQPRFYISDQFGKGVDGFSLHKPSEQYYSLSANG